MSLSIARALTILFVLATAFTAGACGSLPKAAYRSPDVISGMSELDQANYFAENRQFDNAIVHFEYALTDRRWAHKNAPAWNSGLKKLMTIVIEEKKDLSLALELLSRMTETKAIPAAYAKEVKNLKTRFKAQRSAKS